jgi:hypothetical protein
VRTVFLSSFSNDLDNQGIRYIPNKKGFTKNVLVFNGECGRMIFQELVGFRLSSLLHGRDSSIRHFLLRDAFFEE